MYKTKALDMRKLLFIAMAFTACLLLTSVPVLANNANGDAVSDIMNHDRFQGAINTISWLTERIDFWFTVIITATAFFIISTALLKNACAGTYCANHKFWDKVAEAHEKKEAMNLANIFSSIKNKQFGNIFQGGSIKDFFLGIVPNIKALTDFDDADIEPKQYFMKAIPQMIACVIIGVFIYNGYYRDTASAVGSFGSEICNRVFSSVDPGHAVDVISQTSGTPENIYVSDNTLQGKACHKISTEVYKVELDAAEGLTEKDSKSSLMRDCEDLAYKMTTAVGAQHGFWNKNRLFDYSVTSLQVMTSSNLNATNAMSSSSAQNTTSTSFGKGSIKCEKLNETGSQYHIYYTGPALNTISSYIKDNANSAKLIVQFTLVGSQKSMEEGSTKIAAQPGNWSSSNAALVEWKVPATGTGSNTNGSPHYNYFINLPKKALESSDSSQLTKAMLSSIKEVLNMSSLSLKNAVVQSWNNFNAGGGQNPAVRLTNVEAGTVWHLTARVAVTTHPKSVSADKDNQTMYMVVPVDIVCQKKGASESAASQKLTNNTSGSGK